MKNEAMTELQRQALEHLGKARQEGLSIIEKCVSE